jgi:predicted neuraminidase
MKNFLRHGPAIVALVLTAWAAWSLARAPAWPSKFASPDIPVFACSGREIFETTAVRDAVPHYAHATTAIALGDGRLRAFWYEGAIELGHDVKIFTSAFDGTTWAPAVPVIGPDETARSVGRFVYRIGNPLVYRGGDGAMVLVYASVGIGGWSATSLNAMRSVDEGATWSPPRRIRTSPTFDFATNVRGAALAFADGSTMLPAYNEFLRNFSELYWIDANLDVRGRRRIGARPRQIQPFVIALDERRARAFMRSGARPVTLASETDDAGRTWSPIVETAVPQFDKPVAVVALDARRMLMASTVQGNATPLGPIVLSLSEDAGATWKPIFTFPGSAGITAPSMYYPWLMRGRDGTFHLLFTYRDESMRQGSRLMHARFNADWLAARGGPPCS